MPVLDKKSQCETATMLTAEEMVGHTYAAHRRLGLKASAALEDTASALRLTVRHVRSVVREGVRIRPDRADGIAAAYRQWQRQHLARMETIIEKERALLLRAIEGRHGSNHQGVADLRGPARPASASDGVALRAPQESRGEGA